MKFYPILLSSLIITSCTSISPGPTREEAIAQANQRGFALRRYPTSYFLLTTYQRISPHAKVIHVYIEGDGHSWKTRYQLSDDPTPHQPLALLLAIHDPHPDVCYIARPCQYTPLKQDIQFNPDLVNQDIHFNSPPDSQWDSHCNAKYWSSHRYAPEVIQSTMDVLDRIKPSQDTQFKVVGFSGGASVAALLAAQRKDVFALVTVAGDLNHEALNKHHHTSPLTGSLNPMHYAKQLDHTPQHHLVGRKDKIVPEWVSEQFAKAVDQDRCVKRTVLKGVSHHQGWVERWPEIISQDISCTA